MRVRLVSDSHFSAAHRLHREDWDEARNRRVFDKCNNPNGHGHTYGLEVTVEGEIDPETGKAISIERIEVKGDNADQAYDADDARGNSGQQSQE